MAKAPKLVHLVLQTNRLKEMRDWYCTVLGAHVVFENDFASFLTYDEEHHRLGLISIPGLTLVERTPHTVGLQHTAFTYDTLPDLLDRYTKLKNEGIDPFLPVQHGPTTSLYYKDPDGNLAELQIDNFATPDEINMYLNGPEYTADPIGPSFDPRLMVEALQAGTEPEELITRAWALAGPALPHPMTVLAGVGASQG